MNKRDIAVFFDFDSTVVTKESLDETIAHALAGHPEKERLVREVERITNLGMEGKLSVRESIMKRLSVVTINRTHLEHVGRMLTEHITPGMHETISFLKEQNYRVYIVSGGFRECILPTATLLGVEDIDCFTNECFFDEDGNITDVNKENPVWTDDGKKPVLEYIMHRDDIGGMTIMIGDGNNDLKSYQLGTADTFIAFTGNVKRSAVVEEAPYVANSMSLLSTLLSEIIATEV